MQPIEVGKPAFAAAGAPCVQCGLVLAPALLVCPSCQTLVHAAELKSVAAAAEQATLRGDIADALVQWRRALELLPANSKQAARITNVIRELRERPQSPRMDAPAPAPAPTGPQPTGWKRWGAGVSSALAFALFKLKSIWLLLLTGWKPLLLGLTKLGTLWTMLLSIGVYWTLYGWRFALGFIGCIYVHEIGHVVALKKLGIAASAPMFIPGFGAVVRMEQYPIDVDEEAAVGLAGPRWGLGVSLVVYALAWLTHSKMLGAIAHVSAWINLFNLVPIPPLDGGRGFRALGNKQRVVLAVTLGIVFWLTSQAFVGIIAALALVRSFEKRPNETQNLRVLLEYITLASLLAFIAHSI